ncbi:hypothetical protein D0T12_10590 [Actinomadura spongiicola]|uniref:PH domain-containing protein n=2 Tax=Actinomadura spongiicola TaxID=2303421 RepID=A0A372GJF1_9ACTN|nr:hypothetical protein D0T12_10590 [Actinomadura spongiicola]
MRGSPHYRAFLPHGVALTVAFAVVSALVPLWLLALDSRLPDGLLIFASTLVGSAVGVLPAQRVVLSTDGRLRITGFGQRFDVDARRLTAITVSRRARAGFGFAVVHWDGGRRRLWQSMKYLPRQPTGFGRWFGRGPVAEDFRSLVYRLYLSNPSMTVEGVRPPAWWRSPNGGQHPGEVAGLH